MSSHQKGARISRFTLMDLLGRGGMGEVYAARDDELERTVAIKLLNATWSGQPGAEERFTREARTASALNHPNIVTVHEVIRSGSTVAIVMERVEGVSLRAIAGPVPVSQVLSIGRQTASALAVAHAAGIVHRDIKPENIMLRPDGQVKVLDFGLARPAPGREPATYQTADHSIPPGTWRYMSPEHYRNLPLTGKSDVFALGIVLYELSTGRHPFASDSPLETLHDIAVREPAAPSTLNPSIPATLEAVILSSLQKNPADRPDAAAIAKALEEGEALSQTGVALPGRRFGGKRIAGVAALVMLLLAAARVIYHRSRAQPLEFTQITTLLPENRATAAAISPDGKFLAYANVDGIFLRVIKDGETTLLNGPRDFAVDRLAWLPDGARMIASGFSEETNRASIWSISAASGSPRELRADARSGVPSPDGSRITFLSADYSSIWTMAGGGEEPRRIISGQPEDTFPIVLWSPDGRFLVFQRRHYSGRPDKGFAMFDRFYERSLESARADTGGAVARLPDVWVQSAVAMPKGRILLLRPESAGPLHANQLLETSVDPASGKFAGPVRPFDAPVDDSPGRIVGMSATADGATVAVIRELGQAAVFVADFEPAALRIVHGRRLTLDGKSNYPHAWTADSGSVVFESNRNGNWDIFRQGINERVPDLIVGSPTETEVLPQLSPDGRYLLYAAQPIKGPDRGFALTRVPIEGGPPEVVNTGGALDEFRCSLQPSGRCVVRTTLKHDYFVYSELDPVRGKGSELARTAWQETVIGDWDVSPDGKFVAIPNHDSRSARIRVIPLGRVRQESREREVALAGLANISGLTWVPGSDAWFVTITTTVGKRVLHCDLEGRVHSLGDINGWIVPARDGRHVAYEHTILQSNVWSFSSR